MIEFNPSYFTEHLKSHFEVTATNELNFNLKINAFFVGENDTYFSLVRDAEKIIYLTKTIKVMWKHVSKFV